MVHHSIQRAQDSSQHASAGDTCPAAFSQQLKCLLAAGPDVLLCLPGQQQQSLGTLSSPHPAAKPCKFAHSSASQHFHLQDLSYEENDNPHGQRLAPLIMYAVGDVARKALQVNGPTGQNPALRKKREQEEQARTAIKQRMADEQARKAARLTPATAAEKRCKAAGVVPDTKLTKTDVMNKFCLDSWELQNLGVAFESKPNPRNPRWTPMQLYKAGDVAQALVARQMRQQARAQSTEGRAAALQASRARSRSVAAAIEKA